MPGLSLDFVAVVGRIGVSNTRTLCSSLPGVDRGALLPGVEMSKDSGTSLIDIRLMLPLKSAEAGVAGTRIFFSLPAPCSLFALLMGVSIGIRNDDGVLYSTTRLDFVMSTVEFKEQFCLFWLSPSFVSLPIGVGANKDSWP